MLPKNIFLSFDKRAAVLLHCLLFTSCTSISACGEAIEGSGAPSHLANVLTCKVNISCQHIEHNSSRRSSYVARVDILMTTTTFANDTHNLTQIIDTDIHLLAIFKRDPKFYKSTVFWGAFVGQQGALCQWQRCLSPHYKLMN